MKRIIPILLAVLICQSLFAQKKIWNETEAEKTKRLEWWQHDRFGMFIHWGSYALAGRHEWVKKRERIPDDEYPAVASADVRTSPSGFNSCPPYQT